MAKVLSHGPVPTGIGDPPETIVLPETNKINYTDFRVIDEGPGKVVYTDITAPIDQPSTLRIAQVARPNVYAGTAIEAANRLPISRGCDTVVEIKETWVLNDTSDSTYRLYMPVRAALTLNLPTCAEITEYHVTWLLTRLLAALAEDGSTTIDTGLTALLHGSLDKI